MKTHIFRSLKYLLKLLLLVAAIYALMYFTGTLGTSIDELFGMRGILMLAVLALTAALQPLYGFITRPVAASLADHQRQIREVMLKEGYTLQSSTPEQAVFRASRPLSRLWAMGDDKVVVTQQDERTVTFAGQRKVVVQAVFRLESALLDQHQQ